MRKVTILFMMILFVAIVPVQAVAPGEPDITFGTGGFIFGIMPVDANPRTVAVDAFGRIIVAGEQSGSTGIVVARFNAEGILDTSFGIGGSVILTPGTGSAHTSAGLALDSLGRIVVFGNSETDNMFIARLLDNGTLDSEFNGGISLIQVQPGLGHMAAGLALTSTDQPVISAMVYGQLVAIRLNVAGTPDTGFDGDGYAEVNFGDTATAMVGDVVVGSDGKITVVGYRSVMNQTDTLLARFNMDGSRDLTFGSGGLVFSNATNEAIFNGALDSNGKIVIIGATGLGSGNIDGFIARYNVDGSLDTSFGSSGTYSLDIQGDDFFGDLVIDASGSIIVVGRNGSGPENNMVITRFMPDGLLDTGFGTNGVNVRNFTGTEGLMSVALQGDKIIAQGYGVKGGLLARYHNQSGSGTDLLANGGFETNFDGKEKSPDGWVPVNSSSDRVRCNLRAAEGGCAYHFLNGDGEKSKLKQSANVSGLMAGDQLSLVAYVRGRGAVNLRITVELTYDDTTTEKITLRLKRGTKLRYRILQETLTLPKNVIGVDLIVLNRGTSGRSLLDGVQLIHLPQSATRQDGWLPLPPQPNNLRSGS